MFKREKRKGYTKPTLMTAIKGTVDAIVTSVLFKNVALHYMPACTRCKFIVIDEKSTHCPFNRLDPWLVTEAAK